MSAQEEPMPLEHVARAQADLAAGASLESVLAREGIEATRLENSLAHWLERMSAEAQRGVRKLGARYARAFLDHRPELLVEPAQAEDAVAPAPAVVSLAPSMEGIDTTAAAGIPALRDEDIMPFSSDAPVRVPTSAADQGPAPGTLGGTAFVARLELDLPPTPFERATPAEPPSSTRAPSRPAVPVPAPPAPAVSAPIPLPAAPPPAAVSPAESVDETAFGVQLGDLGPLPFSPSPTPAMPAPEPAAAPHVAVGATGFIDAQSLAAALPFEGIRGVSLERYVQLGVLLGRTAPAQIIAALAQHGLTRDDWDTVDRGYRERMSKDAELRRRFDDALAAMQR